MRVAYWQQQSNNSVVIDNAKRKNICFMICLIYSDQDSTLNLTVSNEQSAILLNTPWGSPQSKNTSNIGMIVSNDFVSGIEFYLLEHFQSICNL